MIRKVALTQSTLDEGGIEKSTDIHYVKIDPLK